VVEPDTRSSLPGLFIAGEDAGGAHGANRLGGNGVANSTVFGGIAGDEMAAEVADLLHWREPDLDLVHREIDACVEPFNKPSGDINGIRDRLLDLMWDQVGVLRDADRLQTALSGLSDLRAELSDTGLSGQSPVFNLSWHDWLNLRSLIDVSEVIAQASLSRENSRGAHFREDFPDAGSLEDSYFTLVEKQQGDYRVERRPVEFSIVKPGESLIND
ncbi:MAG: FAD-binding protein, partial [Pseudomonadota bacterium]